MSERTIRLKGNVIHIDESSESAVQSIAAEKNELKEKVDRFADIFDRVAKLKAAHRRELAGLEKELKSLKTALIESAKGAGTNCLHGNSSVVEFDKSTARMVNPKRFFDFLTNSGDQDAFWRFSTVGLQKVFDEYGEKVLERAGVVDYVSDDYGKVSVREAPPVQ